MAKTGPLAAGGEGEGEGAALPTEASPRPPRPSISLPPRSSFENLFRDSGGGGGGLPEASPGPLTLVSSFFAEDPESESRSFTQLLVGAMNSPVAAVTRPAGIVSGELEKVADGGGPQSGSGLLWVGQHRPGILTVNQSQAVTIPPGLSPASLLDSPGLFSSGLGTFGTSHQEALAKVTAQVSSAFMTSSLNQPGVQEIATLKPEDVTFESTDGSHSDQRSQPTAVVVDKPAEDGYNWRKYGQKMVKGSEYPRSYYKCSHLNCPVKKKVEHSVDGQITEIIYKGHHNHQRPAPNKHSREGGSLPAGSNEIAESFNNPARHESSYHSHQANLGRPNDASSATSASKRDREPDSENREQLSGSSDDEEASEMTADRRENQDADAKRRNVSDSSQRALSESKIIVQTTSEVDLLDDGYRWRKYGQKVVKGNPHPRSYYKCTYLGCNVRKHIERAASDPKAVITTYEGKHNHDVPASRSSKS